ncbi:SEL1L family protein [Megaselia abdita]
MVLTLKTTSLVFFLVLIVKFTTSIEIDTTNPNLQLQNTEEVKGPPIPTSPGVTDKDEESSESTESSDDYEMTVELRELVIKPIIHKMGLGINQFTDAELKTFMKPIFQTSQFDPKKFSKKMEVIKFALDEKQDTELESPDSEDPWEITEELKDLVTPLFHKSNLDLNKLSEEEVRSILRPVFKASKFDPVSFNIRVEEIKKQMEKRPAPPSESPEGADFYEKGSEMIDKMYGETMGYSLIKSAADKGHKQARAKIAWAHLMGHYFSLDINFAKDEFVQLAEVGVAEAHMGLAFMYSVGIGFNVSQAKALVHYNVAALGGDVLAKMAMGYRYMHGINVATSCEKSLEFYSAVAKKVADKVTFSGGSVVHKIRLLEEVENPTGPETDLVEYYQLLADKGDVSSQVGLGQLYYQGGRATLQDPQRAYEYFQQAANAGNAIGFAFLGKMYLDGNDFVKADNDTAFKYFKKAAELGNPIGQSGLGIMYLRGSGVTKDTQKAITFFTQAADQGWVDGQLQLGLMYYHGNGVQRDFKLALKYFSIASQANHILANYYVALMHSKGLGVMRSCPAALDFYKNVAERGKYSHMLMNAYRDFKNGQSNEAFLQYAVLAEIGVEAAQSNAAFLLDKMEVTLFGDRHEDLIRAFNYWKRSAAQGYSAAQVKLGDYYYYGHGIHTDFELAASLYR